MFSLTPTEIQYLKEHISDSKVSSIIACCVSCGIIAYIAVGLRFFARRLVPSGVSVDDWMIFAALVSFTVCSWLLRHRQLTQPKLVYTGFIIGFALSTVWGAGRHVILVTSAMALGQVCTLCFHQGPGERTLQLMDPTQLRLILPMRLPI